MWRKRLGSNATYINLIGVFEDAGYQNCADFVRRVCCGKYCEFSLTRNGAYDCSLTPRPSLLDVQVCTQKSRIKEGLVHNITLLSDPAI